MGKNLVLAGGGHAHMTVMLNIRDYIERGHHVTLISPEPYHYYSGMGPGMLSGVYRPQEVRFCIKKMVEDRGGVFIQDAVIRIDPEKRALFLKSGGEISYDVVSVNIGSEIPLDSLTGVTNTVYPVKPIINLVKARTFILETISKKGVDIVVLGGGPAGVEVSANAWRLVQEQNGKARITLVTGSGLFHNYPEKVKRLVRNTLQRQGITIYECAYAKAVEQGSVILADGRRFPADIVIAATGVRPPSLFQDSGLPAGEDGGLFVNAHLQSVLYPNTFGGGDCISLESHRLEKIGVYAVRQNPILYHNLFAALEGGTMKTFSIHRRYHYTYLLIFNMGDGTGILWKGPLVWSGKLAWKLKDYIDRRFMRTFQVSGEREEKE